MLFLKAIILVAGYATRLYPLTLNKPKALLCLNNKPLINYIVDEINNIDEINEIIVISNHKFYEHFVEWGNSFNNKKKITILDDGTNTVETRLGAIGDIDFCINKCNIDEEIMVIAGDNFFTYDLKEYFRFYKEHNKDCIVLKKMMDYEALKSLAVVSINEEQKVIELEEKPQNPKSDLAAFATYIYKKDTIKLFKKYLDDGNNKDAPGFFVEWLYKVKDVYGYIMNGDCFDIGTVEALEEVEHMLKNQEEQ